MFCGQKRQIQHCLNVLWSKTSDSARLKCFVVHYVRFSVFRMCLGKKIVYIPNSPNVMWLKTLVYACVGHPTGLKQQ
jgi:hypothetical protein